jgi:hypothetical protein
MGNLVVVVSYPSFGCSRTSVRLRKTCMSNTPRRKLLLERSMNPFCIGRPGSMKSTTMSLRSAHSAKASAMNSSLLSRRSLVG